MIYVNYTTYTKIHRKYACITIISEHRFRPECVGEALITVLQKGQPGSVWVCENGDTVYEIEIDTMQHTKGFMQKG